MTDEREVKWAKAIELARVGMAAEGYSATTIERTLKQVARFGRECGFEPWDVDRGIVEAWLGRLVCSVTRGYSYRTALRTFYRWALRAGWTSTDPTAALTMRVQARRPPETWHTAVKAYRRHMEAASLSDQTVALRCYQLVRLASELHVSDPWSVTTQHLVDWLAGHTWGRGSTYSYRSLLRGFYGWADQVGYVAVNPAAGLPKVRLRSYQARPAPDGAYRDAIAFADDRTALMLRLAGEIGLRSGEVAQVHTDELSRGQDGLWWLQVTGKGDRVRMLPISDSLAAALRACGPGFVFPGQIDGHLSRARVTQLMSAALPDEYTAHTLRHRFATKAYAAGNDLLGVQQLLGHARPDTTQAYVSVPGESLRRLVAEVAR